MNKNEKKKGKCTAGKKKEKRKRNKKRNIIYRMRELVKKGPNKDKKKRKVC